MGEENEDLIVLSAEVEELAGASRGCPADVGCGDDCSCVDDPE